jgi:hypothetical protein
MLSYGCVDYAAHGRGMPPVKFDQLATGHIFRPAQIPHCSEHLPVIRDESRIGHSQDI